VLLVHHRREVVGWRFCEFCINSGEGGGRALDVPPSPHPCLSGTTFQINEVEGGLGRGVRTRLGAARRFDNPGLAPRAQ
jgi:hypothetical protein